MGELWYYCSCGNPEKDGEYLLQVGVRPRYSPATQIGVVKAKLRDGAWDIPKYYLPMKWSRQIENAAKYGNFRDIIWRGNNKCLE